jgi:hypothetical protein
MQQMYNSVSCAALRNNDYFQEVSWVCAFLSTFAILVPLNPARVILTFAQLISLLGFLRSYIMYFKCFNGLTPMKSQQHPVLYQIII